MKPPNEMTVLELEQAIDVCYDQLRIQGAITIRDEWVERLNSLTMELQSRPRRKPLAQEEQDGL